MDLKNRKKPSKGYYIMVMPRRRETVTFRDAAIIFKNFTGEKRQYNAEGDRNFSVMMGEPDALDLQRQGWNVKPMKRREEDDQQLYHLKVSVSFANRPPRCWLVSSGGRTMLGDGLVGMLDQLESIKVDLVVVAYDWEMNGNSGRKAYLQSLFFHMYEDELELEYADMPQLAAAGDGTPREIEPGSRMAYDYEGEVVEGEV
jgi:hypothetical protein